MVKVVLKPLEYGYKVVEIPEGKRILGRGSFLGCADKKVSRNRAILEVKHSGEVTLTSIHVNPCFYSPYPSSDAKILRKNRIQKLSSGDVFSLLPNTYRYQIEIKEDDEDSCMSESNTSTAAVVGIVSSAIANSKIDVEKEGQSSPCNDGCLKEDGKDRGASGKANTSFRGYPGRNLSQADERSNRKVTGNDYRLSDEDFWGEESKDYKLDKLLPLRPHIVRERFGKGSKEV